MQQIFKQHGDTLLPYLIIGLLMKKTTSSVNVGLWLTLLFGLTFFVASCSKSESGDAKTSGNAPSPGQVLSEKPNYGKIKEVAMDPVPNAVLVEKGQRVFDVTCTSCHKYSERYVGPGLGGVTHRRTPEFVMNMILDTETMLEQDDTVKCMLLEYLLKMPNMQIDETDARNVLEHLRHVGLHYDGNNAKKEN